MLSLRHRDVVPWHVHLDCCGCLRCRQQTQYVLFLHFQAVDRGGGLVGGGSGSCCSGPLCCKQQLEAVDFVVQVVDCSGCLCVGDYGGGVLDSVNVNGLLCGGPLKSGGIGGGLFGGGVGDSLRCGGVNAELLRLQLRIDASVGGGGGGLELRRRRWRQLVQRWCQC